MNITFNPSLSNNNKQKIQNTSFRAVNIELLNAIKKSPSSALDGDVYWSYLECSKKPSLIPDFIETLNAALADKSIKKMWQTTREGFQAYISDLQALSKSA